jgi:hypothetical protein
MACTVNGHGYGLAGWHRISSVVTRGLEPSLGSSVPRQWSLVAFVSYFGVDSNNVLWGSRYAVDFEEDSVCVLIADILVRNRSRCASTFECDRGGKVYRLRCCPFSFPQSDMRNGACDVRRRIHLSGAAGLRQTVPRCIRPQRPTTSGSLGFRTIGSSSTDSFCIPNSFRRNSCWLQTRSRCPRLF